MIRTFLFKLIALNSPMNEQTLGIPYFFDRVNSVNQNWSKTVQETLKLHDASYLLMAGKLHCYGFGDNINLGRNHLLEVGGCFLG